MSFNTPNLAPGPNSSKVAIPRLQRPDQSKLSADRRRVTRACTACRSHKIKCTGGVPQCKQCETTRRDCKYVLPRKDRLKIITERCIQMAGLLRKLHTFADEENSACIGELLKAAEEDMVEDRQTAIVSKTNTNNEVLNSIGTVFDCKSSGQLQGWNTESLDLLDEDLHKNDRSRATGFVGQNSDVQWLRSFLLLERIDGDVSSEGGTPFRAPHNEQVSAVTYYLDHDSISIEFQVDPYGFPTFDVVEQLLSTYMEKVHDTFPIFPRKRFENQCRKYFDLLRHGSAPRLNIKWQAILNLVFAIGAKYLRLFTASWRADERDHMIYRARAQALALNGSTLEQHPDLLQIQIIGLLAFYYLSIGQVSRAWTAVGVALRFAMSLGLHVRNEDRSASGSKREVLIRVWWSLYRLERQIGSMTGRPSMIVEQCCSVPLPAPFSEQQILENANLVDDLWGSVVASTASPIARGRPFVGSHSWSDADSGKAAPHFDVAEANAGSYFRATVQLCTITQSITVSLYMVGTKVRSPDELHQDIVQLGQRLDDWLTKLPRDFNFQTHPHGSMAMQDPFLRERRLLAFQFYGARILLTRPCLGSLEESAKHAEETTIPVDFSRRMADICIETAKAVVDLLPNQPQPRFLYEYGPWWTIVHNLMQALAVLLLALSYSSGVLQYNAVIARCCQKIIRWLRSLDDPLADRAYRVALGCFAVVSNRLSLPVSDDLFMGSVSPVPSGDRGFERQKVPPGAPLSVPNVSHNHARITDKLSAFLPYDSSIINGMYLPPGDVQTSYQHRRGI